MSDNSTFGGGFLGILTLIFITLKLVGYVEWSWAWVLAPLWLPIVLFIAFVAAVLLYRRVKV